MTKLTLALLYKGTFLIDIKSVPEIIELAMSKIILNVQLSLMSLIYFKLFGLAKARLKLSQRRSLNSLSLYSNSTKPNIS